jgi:hypothetical protein
LEEAHDLGCAAWRAGDRRVPRKMCASHFSFRIKKTSFRIVAMQRPHGALILPDGRSRFRIQKSSDQVIDFIEDYF